MRELSGLPSTLQEQAALVQRRELSPMEFTSHCLARIERLQPTLNAFITVTAEQALHAARQAEREITAGRYRGPLHGIPLSLKDLIDTAGVATTAGSKILAGRIPEEDATVVCRLKEAGAILLGKNNLHEFAFGITSENLHYGPVRNPWNRDLNPGGSSGGSAAAVAAGLCAASVGSDTGGSIRIPASSCGCVGLKPTYGRVSCHGVIPLSPSMDHVGPLARSVADAAILLQALAGRDAADPASSEATVPEFLAAMENNPVPVRLGLCDELLAGGMDAEVEQAFQSAVKALEARCGAARRVNWPALEQGAKIGTVIAFTEAAAYHEEWVRTRPEDYSPEVLKRLRMGLEFKATEYLHCVRLRQELSREAESVFREIDLLLYPTLPFVGARIGTEQVRCGDAREDVRTASIRFNRPANLTGYPALALPCGFSRQGLPIGLQLMAAPFRELLLLQVGHAYQSQTEWHRRQPPLAEEPADRPAVR